MFVYGDIEKSLLKHTSGFFISQFYSLCTLAFLPLECQLFLVKQINNLSNAMTQNTVHFKLELCCKSSGLSLSSGNNYKLCRETNQLGIFSADRSLISAL